MKHYLTLIFAFVTTLSFAAYPVGSRENIDGSVLGWDESNRCWRPVAVDATGQMKGTSTGDVVVESISVDTSKIEGYLNIPQGEGEDPISIAQSVAEVSGKLDSITMDSYLDDGTITGSVIGQADITKLKPLKEVITSGSPIATKTHRAFVEIRAAKPTDEFQIGFRNASNAMRPVKGRIMVEVNEAQDIYVYIPDGDNAPLALYVTEGWR